ncbi:MAG: SUMF1/EgtB/PvdO family nonheme iron enzyme [Mucinivorans sp.]
MKKSLTLAAALLFAAMATTESSAQVKNPLDVALAAKAKVEATVVKGLPIISEVYRKGMAPGHVEVDLTGLKELVLVTWGTPDGNDFDHAVWADAKLIGPGGSQTWLSDVNYKYKKIDGNWFRQKTNFSDEKFSIGSKKYIDGVLAHANGILVVDLQGKGYTKFISDIGIDNGSNKGSAVFKVLSTSGKDEAEALLSACPEIGTTLVPFIGTTLENWLTTPGTALERAALEKVVKQLSQREYFDTQAKGIESLPSRRAQIEGYIALTKKATDVLNVQTQLAWLNPKALVKAFNDFKDTKGYDVQKYQTKVNEFLALTADGLKGVFSLDEKAIKDATRALALKREILLSNPALDMDKILVSKYNLGNGARGDGAPSMGTPPANWSSQLSGSRHGFDAQIVELSNLRAPRVSERVVYKAPNDGVLSDINLHWSADKFLFTGNDKGGHFQVYELPVQGGVAPEQVTKVTDSDLEFFDAAYLPSGKVLVSSNIGYHGVPCVNGSDAVANYSLLDRNTGDIRRLTFDQENNWNATVLANGKVMYTRWEYTDLMHYYSRIVFHMNPDGTEQKALYGSGSMFPNSTFDMQQLPGNQNRFIGIISGHHGVARSGRLIIFDPTKARKGAEGMIQELPFSERPIVTLVKDELVNGVWPQFIKPHPLNDNYFLVSAKLTPNSLWGIYLVDVFDNLTLIAEYEGQGLINPVPVRPRPLPAIIPEKVPMKIADCTKESTVFIQDIYEGEGLPGVPRGTVKELRVLTYEFAYLNTLSDHVNNGIQAGWDIKRELGRVPVNPDGSVIFTVPANTPISLQPLDSTGAAIQLMRSWFTGMPGETVSCVGCHENQNQIAKPMRTAASKQKPSKLTVPEGGVRPFTFELEVQPILDRACIACHNGDKLAAGIDYTKGRMYDIKDWAGTRSYSKSYLAFHPYFYRQGPEAEMAVLNPYEYNITNSEMIQMLRNGHHGVQLTDKEWERLTTWVDFNLPYDGTFAANPYKAIDGETYDQKERRIELAIKYSGIPVDWEKELEDYTAVLASKPKIEPTMPAAEAKSKTKEFKVKGWPFTAEQAAAMTKEQPKREVDLGNGQSMTFVYIPAGSYVSGGTGTKGTLAPAKVVIKKGFWMAEKEVTNAQMRALIPTHDSRYIGQQWKDHTTPGYFVDSAGYPATKVSYDEATLFTRLLSEKSGMKIALPTEQQWEWAARGGAATDFWFGSRDVDYAPYENLSDLQMNKMAVSGIDPQPMSKNDPWFPLQAYIPKDKTIDDGHMLMTNPGCYKPNPWGLYDINGNVAEWTSSNYDQTQNKVVRGGSWYDRAKKAVIPTRRNFVPWHKVWNVGFRPIIEN